MRLANPPRPFSLLTNSTGLPSPSPAVACQPSPTTHPIPVRFGPTTQAATTRPYSSRTDFPHRTPPTRAKPLRLPSPLQHVSARTDCPARPRPRRPISGHACSTTQAAPCPAVSCLLGPNRPSKPHRPISHRLPSPPHPVPSQSTGPPRPHLAKSVQPEPTGQFSPPLHSPSRTDNPEQPRKITI